MLMMMKKINVSLDENDLEKLKKRFNASSDDEAVRSAISHLLNKKAYIELLEFEGNIRWEGNLNELRDGRV
jgi:Arc/MetJ-type ribon-helix-helix transcriptional regulator